MYELLLFVAAGVLTQGCSDHRGSDMPMTSEMPEVESTESTEADSDLSPELVSAPPPVGLRDTELYSIQLRDHVVFLDAIIRFDGMRVSQSPSCVGSTEQSDADDSRFGSHVQPIG